MLILEKVNRVHRSIFIDVKKENQSISPASVACPVQGELVAELALQGGWEEGGADRVGVFNN